MGRSEDVQHLITLQQSLATLTIRNQRLENEIRQALRLLERSMKFTANVPELKNDYDNFLETSRRLDEGNIR